MSDSSIISRMDYELVTMIKMANLVRVKGIPFPVELVSIQSSQTEFFHFKIKVKLEQDSVEFELYVNFGDVIKIRNIA